jgi:hypothetical protein
VVDLIDEYRAAEGADYVTWGGSGSAPAAAPAAAVLSTSTTAAVGAVGEDY